MTVGPIISLSLPKSGTTTLARALRHAKLRVADWRIKPGQTDNEALHKQLVAPLLYEDYYNSGDPLARLGEFDAITEASAINGEVCYWPQTDAGLLNAIELHHPRAKFVLSMRPPDKVAASMMGWNTLGSRRLPGNNVPGLPRPFGSSEAQIAHWVAGHYIFCARMFKGASNFLAYDLEDPDASKKISDFLELPLPWWGHANKNHASKAHNIATTPTDKAS